MERKVYNDITPLSSVVKISTHLEGIFTRIQDSRAKKIAEHNIKEIELLKSMCKSDIVNLNVMSCQAFVRLVETGVLEGANILNMFIAMLPNSSQQQYFAISDAIVELLLIGLKQKVSLLKKNDTYKSQYGLKTQQHPLITLIQNNNANLNDLAFKIKYICGSVEKIQPYLLEYLRPFFLYVLCNPQILPDAKIIWSTLIDLTKDKPEAKVLMQEIVCWSKISSFSTCHFTSMLLIETVDCYLQRQDHKQAIDLMLYQAIVVKNLIKYGTDPRPTLRCIMRVLEATAEQERNYYNVLLILLAETLHLIPPAYLPDLLHILNFIAMQNCGNQYILNMCLDGIIQWMSQTAFIPADGEALALQLVHQIDPHAKTGSKNLRIATKQFDAVQVRNCHPDIALAFDLSKLVESFEEESDTKNVFTFVDALNIKKNFLFFKRLNLFLRALFLSEEPSMDCWFKIYQAILELVKMDSAIAYEFLMTYIYKLAYERIPEIQLELLRGLPAFGVCKDNIPVILNTLRNIAASNPNFGMDLYLRLWRVEPRTYHSLLRQLSAVPKAKNKLWEYEIAKTYTIREICYEKPSQHGSDMVSRLSDTLNRCTDESGDLATSLALDSIIALCESNTVNITSTWREISSKFRHEKRPRSIKSLYKFFALVPALQTPTIEFDQLVDQALDELWSTITRSDDPVIIREALAALKHYEIGNTLCYRHIPKRFQKVSQISAVDIEHQVPGQCWVNLLRNIRPDCGAAVSDLLAHYIYVEINSYHSHVYRIPEGKPEPRKLETGLYGNSILRAVTSYLIDQSRYGDEIKEPHAVVNGLRAISRKFPKPIPPLDWCFLHSFFHLSFEARKYCVLIAKNQVLHSGTARRLLENFLLEFEPNCFEEDLLLLLSLLPEIANGVSLQILKGFAEKVSVYCFKESQLSGFSEGCLFEKFLESAKHIFTGKCDIPEVLDVFTLIVERYMDAMDVDSRVFERYTEVVSVLHPNSIDGLTSPANWWEAPIGKLKKATIIRCYLVLYNTQLPNPLNWLSPIIDAFFSRGEDHIFFFRHLSVTLYAFNSDENSCRWVLDLFLQIQALLAESSQKEKLEKALYLLDIFILSVDVLSGCAVLLGNLDQVATKQSERLDIFPESVQFLCEHAFWKEQEARIYEFLFGLYKHHAIPEKFGKLFKKAIICSRNKPYFDNKGVWTKYVGVRK